MKTPKIVFKTGALGGLGRTKTKAIKETKEAVGLAEKIAKKGLARIDKTLKPSSNNDKKSAWKSDSLIVTYFGAGSLRVPSMKKVQNRIERAHKRLAEKTLTIRVFPQSKAPSKTTIAQNLGSVFSPKTFKVFSKWFTETTPLARAGIIVHELNHDLFVDQKIKDKGKRVTVYGTRLAKKLAKEKPASARRSAENFEQFCIAVHES